MDWSAVVLVGLGAGGVLSGILLGSWLRGSAHEQAEKRHEAERALDAMRIAGLDAQLRDRGERLAAAERLDAVRVAERARLADAVGAGGGPAGDRLLLDLGPGVDASTGASGAPGGLPAGPLA